MNTLQDVAKTLKSMADAGELVMTDEFPHPTEEQEREYARVLWKAQEARNELSMLAAGRNVRRRSKFRLVMSIVWVLIAIVCFFVWRYVYLNYLWQ